MKLYLDEILRLAREERLGDGTEIRFGSTSYKYQATDGCFDMPIENNPYYLRSKFDVITGA